MYVMLEYFNRALYNNVWTSVILTIHLCEHLPLSETHWIEITKGPL